MNPIPTFAAKAGSQLTQRSASRTVAASSLAACALGSVLALGAVAYAQDQPIIPDAQVQANVLKALAGAPELAGEDIHTRTVFGVVSLTGSVRTEGMQAQAENLAANSPGVKKVVDEMAVGSTATVASARVPSAGGPGTSSVGTEGQQAEIQRAAASAAAGSDPAPGTAPASSAVINDPERDQQAGHSSASNSPAEPRSGNPAQPRYSAQPGPGYESAPESRRFPDQSPQNRRDRTDRSGYEQNRSGYEQNRSGYEQNQAPLRDGQEAGQRVIIPTSTTLRVRLDGAVSSDRSVPGSSFDGVMMSDVVADGAVAIPRGAQVQGTVISSTRAGVLKGRGDLSLALTSVTLGGRVYPIVTRTWAHHGGDKTIETVNKTAGFGAIGTVVGALAGGGEGAAVGGGIGAAAGLGSSATSGRGQVYLPAESVLTFRLAEAAAVSTVSQQEMQRLAYGSAPNLQPHYPRQRAYPDIYVGPSIYPGYYPGYYPRPYPGYYPQPYGYPPYY